MDSFLVEYMHVALENDADPNVRAMTHYVENPDRIEEYETLFHFAVIETHTEDLRPTMTHRQCNYLKTLLKFSIKSFETFSPK